MSELPYFPFYPKDWLSDRKVATMSMAARGLYITLLCYAWHEREPGTVPKSLVSNLAVTCKLEDSNQVLECFEERGELFFQKRMAAEYEKLAAKRQAQSKGGREAMTKRHGSKLLKSKLKVTSSNQNQIQISDSDTSLKKKQRAHKAPAPHQSLDDLLKEVGPIYPWADLEAEKAKIRGWMLANPGKRKLSRKFVVNWFNRIDRVLIDVPPLNGNGHAAPVTGGFVTRAKIEEYCRRRHFGPKQFIGVAYGKLSGDRYYGKPCKDEQTFSDFMEAIYSDWRPE